MVCALLQFISIQTSAQQASSDTTLNDHLFAAKGHSIVTVATGIPYVGIAEYAYGVSDRFTIGVIAGSTPIIPGYGIRVRNVLYTNHSNRRIYMRTPILYYPETKGLGGEPWILTWPAVNYEIKAKSGIRWSFGFGVVAAACVNDLLDMFGLGAHLHENATPGADESAQVHFHNLQFDHHQSHMNENNDPADNDSSDHHDEGFMGGFWNTVQGGFATSIGSRWMFHAEAGLAMNGVALATDDWVGGPPVILTLGFSYSF